ncbi:15134_t:CDS:2, partial [Racocetra fulgida]
NDNAKNNEEQSLIDDKSYEQYLKFCVATNSLSFKINVYTVQKPYSEWTFNDVSNIFKLPAHYKDLPKFTCGIDKFEDKKSQELILHLIKELNIRQSTVRGDSEAYNSHFVIPFLAVASSICGNKAQIYPEEYIQGRYCRGPVDFCMILENIIISVVEVKRDDFIQGAAQIIVQLHSSLEVENDLVIDKVYGIVTDSKCWYFFECSMNGDKPEYKIHSEHGTTINWGGNIEEGFTEVLGQIRVTINEQEASPTKDILPSSACSELSVISQSSASTIETYSNEENYIGPVDPNLVQNVTSNLGEIEKSSESASSICTETKLLEDREINEFLDSTHKETISNEIRERNRENKFRSQDPLSYDKDISQSNKNKVQRFMLEVSENSSPQLQYTDSIISKVSTANGNVTPNETKFQPSNANFTLLYEKLCDAIILADRKTQEAIMCYCLFGKALIQRRNEIASEKQVDPESNIVGRILNKEIKTQLPADTSDSLLRKRIEKAKKLYKLFDAI